MSTNQTIDGHLRELLQRVLAHHYAEDCQECGIGQSEAWKELRALLDKEAGGDSRAPQPQGQPVAWLVQCRASDLFEQAEPNEKSSNPEHWTDAFPVYREQSAPVVVVPERDAEADHPTDPNEYALGWNDCLDEVTRLNTK